MFSMQQDDQDHVKQKEESSNHPVLKVSKADIVEKGFKIRLNVVESKQFGDFTDNEDRYNSIIIQVGCLA